MGNLLQINSSPVHLSINNQGEICVSFSNFEGTLEELQDFRKSFDYGSYRFGKGRFISAHWKTIHADDFDYCKYPTTVGLQNEHGVEMTLTWEELNELISHAMLFAIKSHGG